MTEPDSPIDSLLLGTVDIPNERKCALFRQYAQDDVAKWQRLIGAQIEHKVLGLGKVNDVTTTTDYIDILIDFPVPNDGFEPRKYRFSVDISSREQNDPFSRESDPYFINLIIPTEVAVELGYLWDKMEQQRIAEIESEKTRRLLEDEQRRQQAEQRRQQAEQQRQQAEQQRQQAEQQRLKEVEKEKTKQSFRSYCIEATSNFPRMKFAAQDFLVDLHDLRLAVIWTELPFAFTEAGLEDTKQELLAFVKQQDQRQVYTKESDSIAWNFARNLSARIAEKAFARFLKGMGYHVQDVAVTQLEPSNNGDYTNFDILVENQPIDVKNARYSPDKADRFSDHRVQKPEKSLHNIGSSVRIGGVLSPFLELEHLLFPDTIPDNYQCRDIHILGVTPHSALFASIIREFRTKNLSIADFHRQDDSENLYLPNWVFSYPKKFYARRKPISNITNREWPNDQSFWTSNHLSLVPCLIAAGKNLDDNRYGTVVIEPWERYLIERLLHYQHKDALELPLIYLSVLWYFVQATFHPSAMRTPRAYRRLLFWDTANESAEHWPLFVYDPKRTVSSLIETLESLGQKREKAIRTFRQFRLHAEGLLDARRNPDENWQRLVAYCGHCGKNPLIWGENETCKFCNLLICDCGFCSHNCSGCEKRRHEYNEMRTRNRPEYLNQSIEVGTDYDEYETCQSNVTSF